MAKEDYREKIEEGRQEIEVESEHSRVSRASRKKKPGKSYGMKVLLVVFIFIPLSFLIYFNFFYEPKNGETAKSSSTNEVQVVTSNTPKKQDANNDAATDESNDESKEQVDAETEAKKAEEQAAAEAEAARLAQEKEAEEASKRAAEEARLAEEAKKAEAAKKAEEEKRKQEQEQNARKHVVQANDTLYSIAMKYYKDPAAVDKIIKANGIKNNNITVGSTLILP